jgi:hypothetical protein
MTAPTSESEYGCGCCDCSRRDFLTMAGSATGLLTLGALAAPVSAGATDGSPAKDPARIRVAFLYPPSRKFADDPDGWWSWPGNDFDAEGRQKQYVGELRKMEKSLGVELSIDSAPVATDQQVKALAGGLAATRPDALLLVMFYNRSLKHADALLAAAAEQGIPVIFYIGLGVKHGSVAHYRRPGVYFIQSLDNFDALEYGLRMVHARKRMATARLLSITEAEAEREGTEKFFGTTVRVVPFSQYAEAFEQVKIGSEARRWIDANRSGATGVRGVGTGAMENSARAYFALRRLLERHRADGLTMNCLRRGMLKPCMAFARLNNQLIPATCENDFPAMYTQLLGQLLTGRPGFQHNPCFDTERNSYYGSHCTCPTELHGPGGGSRPYLLRRFAHTNEGSCAIQVFWNPDDPVTMVRYHQGDPPSLDVYEGRVVASHPMPPAAGCTTDVEIKLTDRPDACMVEGHHNLLFCGEFGRKFRLFAQLHDMQLADTGSTATLPV